MKLRTFLAALWRVFIGDDPPPQSPTPSADAGGEQAETGTASPVAKPAPTETHSTPETPEQVLDWRFGGFDGSRADEDERVRVGRVRMGKDGMTFKWTRGDLGAWGLAHTEAGALACAFYWDGSRWIGGKFDWISSSRLSRDWKNIREGYRGWNAGEFFGAKRRAFCIVSKDGKRRTNLAVDGED